MRCLTLLVISMSIAPAADFTTYIGGANQTPYFPTTSALAADANGDTYVTGFNAVVTKLDSSGNIVFTETLGPPVAYSFGNALAVDPSGNVWVGGQTNASDFPLVNALQSSGGPNGTGFLVKMAPNGTVAYSSYFGGVLGNSAVTGIAMDASGNGYVTGFTDASDFPTTAGLPASPVTGTGPPVYGLFAAKLNSTGQKILYSMVIAGMNCVSCGTPNVSRTVGIGIAVDGSGNAVVAGDTNSTDLPVNSGGNSGPGAFVFKINSAGSELAYVTYLGSNVSVGSFLYPDTAAASPIAADASGNAYVAGYASNQGFVTQLSASGATVWTASLGGENPNMPNAISLDGSGNVWVTGIGGGSFVDQLSADGSQFLYSEDFPAPWAGQSIAVDPSGVVHFAGSGGLISTLTPTQPLAPRVLTIVNAASNQFSGTIAPGEVVSIYGFGLGPTTPMVATPANGFFPTSLGGVQVLVNGTPIPLLYVSASQINAEIPSGVASGGLVNGIVPVQVVSNSVPLPVFRLAVVGSDFAVFEKAGGSMAVINQDGTVNRLANPAKPGSIVSIWATGFGVTGAPADGAVAMAANNYCSGCQLTLSSGAASVTETVEYAGTSPGLIDGLMQINFMIPALLNDEPGGGWVYFTPPGYTQPIQLGWVDVAP